LIRAIPLKASTTTNEVLASAAAFAAAGACAAGSRQLCLPASVHVDPVQVTPAVKPIGGAQSP
jgi:hypothetical protein